MISRIVLIDKSPKQNAQQCRNSHRPADQAKHSKAEPNILNSSTLCPKFPGFQRGNLPAKVSLATFGWCVGIFNHDEAPQSDESLHFPIPLWLFARVSPDH